MRPKIDSLTPLGVLTPAPSMHKWRARAPPSRPSSRIPFWWCRLSENAVWGKNALTRPSPPPCC